MMCSIGGLNGQITDGSLLWRVDSPMGQKRRNRILAVVLCLCIITLSFIETRTQPLSQFQIGFVVDANITFNNLSLPNDHNLEFVLLRNTRNNFQDFVEEFCTDLTSRRFVSIIGFGPHSLTNSARFITQHLSLPYISLVDESLHQTKLQINMYPRALQQADAIVAIAVELGCSCIVIFTTKPDNNRFSFKVRDTAKEQGITFTAIALSQGEAPASEILYISKEILVMNKSGSCVVVLDCAPTLAGLIMETARSLSIPDSRFVWMMLRDAVTSYDVTKIPANVLGLRLPFNEYDFLYDAVTMVTRATKDERFRGIAEESLQNISCFNTGESWKNGDLFYRIFRDQVFSGKTGLVKFNELGNRINNDIDIVRININPDGEKSWEKVGCFDSTHAQIQSNFWIKDGNNTSPNFIRMVTIAEDPIMIVSSNDLLPGEECILTQTCFKYASTSGSNTTKRLVKRCCSGLVIDVLNMLQRDLNFQAEIYFVEDGKYGGYDPKTKTWNGLINDLVQGKADLALTTLTINEVRARAVDFTTAFLHGETKILLSSKEKETSNIVQFNFLFVFDTALWFVILAIVNVFLVYLWCLDRLSPYGHYRTQTRRKRYIFNIPACMSYVWSTVFKLQLDDVTPRSLSARVVSTVFAFGTLILTTSYTANLAANLVTTQESLPVNDIRDPKFTDSSQGFRFATLGSTSTEMIFTRSSDPDFKKIAENMKPYSVSSYSEAIDKLDSGALDAFIDDSPFLDLAASKKHDCSLRIVGRAISMHGYGMALRKNSKWTKPITQLFLKYDRRDFFRKLRDKWFTGICVTSGSISNKPSSMELESFSGLFIACAVAAAICITLLIAEILFKSCGRRCIVTYALESGGSVRDMFQSVT